MTEYSTTSEIPKTPDTVDELMALWQEIPYAQIGSNEPYKVGEDDGTKEERDSVKAAFIAGEIENPAVSYPRLKADAIAAAREQMLDVYEQSHNLPDGIDKDLARQLMRQKIAELDRHLEVAAAWATEDAAERQNHLDRAVELQQEVFGSPEQTHFDHMLHSLRSRAETVLGLAQDETTRSAAAELLELTGNRPEPDDFSPVGLSDRAIKVIKEDLAERHFIEDIMLPPRGDETPMSHDNARLWFKLMQEATGHQAHGWDTSFTSGNAVETSRRDRLVNIGRGRKQFTPEDLWLKDIHERFGHEGRSFNGDRIAEAQNKPMFKFALPGALDFEEGLMTALEQAAKGTKRIPGEMYYLGAGLLLGMDKDGKRRDFRQAYEIMWRRGVVEAAAAGKTANVKALKGSAYQALMRLTRGGAIDTRDLSYYRGYVKASNWLNQLAERPYFERMRLWRYTMSAQFDPTNPLHASYVTR